VIQNQIKLSQLICVTSALLLCNTGFAQTRYVTDDFNVMLRTGPDTKNKIVKALGSGTRLEVLVQDAGAGHSQVRTSQGDVGYLLTRFMSKNPSARDRVLKLESQIEQLKSEPGSLRTLLVKSQDEAKELAQKNSNLTGQLNSTSNELEKIKKISGESITLATRNEELASEVEQLLLDIDKIRIDNKSLKKQSDKQWFIVGGSAVGGGFLLGWILSISSRRSRRGSWGS